MHSSTDVNPGFSKEAGWLASASIMVVWGRSPSGRQSPWWSGWQNPWTEPEGKAPWSWKLFVLLYKRRGRKLRIRMKWYKLKCARWLAH